MARAIQYKRWRQLHGLNIDIVFYFPPWSNVQRTVSVSSAFIQETNLDDFDVKEIDYRGQNAFHYAVSKPNTLKKLLERVADVRFCQLLKVL